MEPWSDTVSAGELHRAFAAGYQAGGDPPEIVYTADIFDADALKLVLDRDIHVNCGSSDMIEQYGAVAPGRKYHSSNQSGIWPRPQSENEHGWGAIQAWNLGMSSSNTACGGPTIMVSV